MVRSGSAELLRAKAAIVAEGTPYPSKKAGRSQSLMDVHPKVASAGLPLRQI